MTAASAAFPFRHTSVPPQNRSRRIALIGAPMDVGASVRGCSMGPEALRVAGIEQALRSLDHVVVDKGNLTGPVNPMHPVHEGYRHLPETVVWCQTVRDAVYRSLRDGELPLVLGGDHSVAIGSVAGVAQHCYEAGKKLYMFWLDAHADFNTPETSPSGNIHGMPVAVLAGYGHPKLLGVGHSTPMLDASRIIQIGIRSVDAVEKVKVVESGVTVFDMRQVDESGMRGIMERALDMIQGDNVHLHVSFDVDFLDPFIAPGVATTVSGGPNYREAQLCMEMIHDSGLVGSMDIVELNPAYDDRNKTADVAVELVESVFGKQILARHTIR